MKIAIASTGLGHVTRGIETWALDTANALHRSGVDVTLFAAEHVDSEAPTETIPCIRRRSPSSKLITRIMPPFSWRWGLKSGYGLEQLTFWQHLRHKLNRGNFDILHIQDPLLANLCRKARAKGKTATKEILAHGTEEPIDFLANFEFLQHLAPWHLEQTTNTLRQQHRQIPKHWTAMPNFIDINHYHPAKSQTIKNQLRLSLEIPRNAFVIITLAAIKTDHKRINYLIREFADHKKNPPEKHNTFLVIAGSKQPETDDLVKLADNLAPENIKFFIDYPHEKIPDLLQCCDAFVLTSLFEMMTIALLQAIATGLPVISHRHPDLIWMAGPAGIPIDMSKNGSLAKTFSTLQQSSIPEKSLACRKYAENNFAEAVVIKQYIDYYQIIS
jgi:glycosyltransferase involved in cell wall biosynthesis